MADLRDQTTSEIKRNDRLHKRCRLCIMSFKCKNLTSLVPLKLAKYEQKRLSDCYLLKLLFLSLTGIIAINNNESRLMFMTFDINFSIPTRAFYLDLVNARLLYFATWSSVANCVTAVSTVQLSSFIHKANVLTTDS